LVGRPTKRQGEKRAIAKPPDPKLPDPKLPDSRSRILDAAEELFAEHGFDAVSVRDITGRAGVRLALLAYYFGAKEVLFEAVIARRVDVLNQIRRSRLEAASRAGPASVEAILEAFIGPYLEMSVTGDQGWRSYGRLIAQVAQVRRWLPLIQKYFDETAGLFVAELQRTAPDASDRAVVRGFVFSVGVMVSTFAVSGRAEGLSQGRTSDEDLEAAYRDMIPFLAAGFRGLVAVRPA
jgi:AcrR family transcriptional regulator